MSENLVLPRVNNNGTSRKELIERMSPHGRDYHPDTDLYQAARDQHQRRAKALTDLRAEIVAEAEVLSKQ